MGVCNSHCFHVWGPGEDIPQTRNPQPETLNPRASGHRILYSRVDGGIKAVCAQMMRTLQRNYIESRVSVEQVLVAEGIWG